MHMRKYPFLIILLISLNLSAQENRLDSQYRETVPDQYQLQIGWGNGTWNISATAYNFFRKSWLSGTRTLSSEFYDYTTSIFSKAAHMRFSLSATYSFGYGKKVDRYNEVEKGKFSNSAILK